MEGYTVILFRESDEILSCRPSPNKLCRNTLISISDFCLSITRLIAVPAKSTELVYSRFVNAWSEFQYEKSRFGSLQSHRHDSNIFF